MLFTLGATRGSVKVKVLFGLSRGMGILEMCKSVKSICNQIPKNGIRLKRNATYIECTRVSI